jgi:hypothetical protein
VGTVIGYRLWAAAHQRAVVLAVEEPTPGRQLRERDRHRGLPVTSVGLRHGRHQPGRDGSRFAVPGRTGKSSERNGQMALGPIHPATVHRAG